MEERDAGRMRENHVAVGVEYLLRRDGALVVVDAVDRARRGLAPPPGLELCLTHVDVRGAEAEPFALMVVLDLQVARDLLDDIRIERRAGSCRRSGDDR